VSRLTQERFFSRSKFGAVVTAREQVTVDVRRHLNARMSKAVLNYLERQSQAAVLGAVDAPRGVEVSKRAQAGVLDYAAFRHDACGDLDGRKPAGEAAVAGHKHKRNDKSYHSGLTQLGGVK